MRPRLDLSIVHSRPSSMAPLKISINSANTTIKDSTSTRCRSRESVDPDNTLLSGPIPEILHNLQSKTNSEAHTTCDKVITAKTRITIKNREEELHSHSRYPILPFTVDCDLKKRIKVSSLLPGEGTHESSRFPWLKGAKTNYEGEFSPKHRLLKGDSTKDSHSRLSSSFAIKKSTRKLQLQKDRQLSQNKEQDEEPRIKIKRALLFEAVKGAARASSSNQKEFRVQDRTWSPSKIGRFMLRGSSQHRLDQVNSPTSSNRTLNLAEKLPQNHSSADKEDDEFWYQIDKCQNVMEDFPPELL